MKKSIPTIKESVLQEFRFMPSTFRGYDLIRIVKVVTGRKYVYGDTVLRKLRKLKAEGKVNYELSSEKSESLYHKLS
jgi:hypothetical protein